MDNTGLMSGGGMPVALPVALPVGGALPVAQTATYSSSTGATSSVMSGTGPIPVAESVLGAMPSAPPMASLSDQWSTFQYTPDEDHGEAPKASMEQASGAVGFANFYSPEVRVVGPSAPLSSRFVAFETAFAPCHQEIGVLQAQAVPVDYVSSRSYEGQLPVAQCAVPVAQATPVLTTAVGMPIFSGQTRCVAETEQDGSSGVKSCDAILDNVSEILNFLNTYNTRPRVACHVHGYHRERRHRTVERTDAEGNRRTHQETYYETVTDFDYKVDMSDYVFPFGYIQSVDATMSVPQLIEAYLADPNLLKTLEMNKQVRLRGARTPVACLSVFILCVPVLRTWCSYALTSLVLLVVLLGHPLRDA